MFGLSPIELFIMLGIFAIMIGLPVAVLVMIAVAMQKKRKP